MNKVVVALALVILAGCGQKGPLYIPQPEKPAPEAGTKAAGTSQAPEANSTQLPADATRSSSPSDNPAPATGN